MNLSDVVAIGRLVDRRQTGESIAVATTKLKKDDGRRAALRMVDRQLTKGNFKLALSLVKQLQRQPSPTGLCGFAAARQVPRRVSSIEQLHLSVAEDSAFQSLLDAILDSIKSSLQASPLEESSVTNEDNDLYLEDDMVKHMQVLQHEAGHFLVGYLLGVLPKQYKVSCMEDKITDANVKFVGFEFLTEVTEKSLFSSLNQYIIPIVTTFFMFVLNRFACVIVGGLVAEHLAFGHSKGHHGDMDKNSYFITNEKLDKVFYWLQFTEDEANTLTRWAVINTLTILNRHSKVISTLVEAMSHGKSIGSCIHSIESNLNHQDI
ncbi:hypothetical protein E3N88_29523 [Mikania micrantha]|uniref:Peptidase M41 domain-containing protein n=1 Tax=Mikania micrantha TaxID=192012 RepID=A0A5N6MJA3_9ASTR|nr:hypothetical protein E3N88_29523 [Mikania micrantha]